MNNDKKKPNNTINETIKLNVFIACIKQTIIDFNIILLFE